MRKNEKNTMTCPLPGSAPKDSSPLAWWRMLPPQAFGESERLHLGATLEQINVLNAEPDLVAALKGDAAAAIEFTFTLMPMSEISLRTDIAMTALLRCARERNAAACLVLAQVLGLTDLGHPYAQELATSWLAYGRLCSENPREFSNAETVLLTAFQQRQREQA